MLPCHPLGLIPFPFGFTLLPAWIICFLFSGFSFGKIYAKRSGANHNGKRETRKASKQITFFQTSKI
ncbi:hypothetical protein AP75_04670 [Kaistella haifensis DSM 19056]|uniref:Uncharacterized protein n=1 Tax=Kaistella haifensis DSM 19056 TaxID=1450526 RepID=A0A246BAP7_9FLAO|nr:hypothetical protein AP75_04670 [Kaistella haifensis DSM 19056]